MKTIVAAAAVVIAAGCSRDTWSYRAVPDTNLSRPNPMATRGTLVLKGDSGTEAAPLSKQTVLMASWQHDSALYHHNVGRTLVIFIDGQPKPGQYWLTSENAVLLTYSAYSAPARERVNLAGSIRVDRVEGNRIVADVAVQETSEIDSSEFIDHPWDAMYTLPPFRLRGQHTFAVTTPADPIFEKSAVKWVAQ
ncbi:MAG TPA: hypothetical protein VLI90_17655 [Tepidisphaeraceae bacterium]|nr:hypothetical protein [Tepidisphaeraceae bacterium]